MRVSVLTIGNELLSGKTINTNASWISKNLFSIGASVRSHVTIPDNKNKITDTLNLLFKSDIDLIICTGGLGVTDDDITRKVIFDYFASKELFDKDYWNTLNQRFSKLGHLLTDSSKSQAVYPDNGTLISNHVGSARGLMYEKNNITLMVLPGVPSEMKAMFNSTISNWVEGKIDSKIFQINIRTTGIPESILFDKVKNIDIDLEENCYNIGYYPSVYGVDVRIVGKDLEKIEKLKDYIRSNINEYIYEIGDQNLEEVLIKELKKKNMTISCAESCTGGLIGHRLTQVPGSSEVYNGGMITYSNESKINQLDITLKNIEDFGAVSEQVALEMAENIKNKFGTSIGVSTTGIAGPGGGSKSKPVGLVYVGYCDDKSLKVKRFNFSSLRESNKIRTSQAVLNYVFKII